MPLYQYECEYCEHKFDVIQSFKDKPLTICPECSMEALRKLLSTEFGVIFKGSGFYGTDSRKATPKERMEQIGNLEAKYGTEELANRYEKSKEKQEKK